MSSPSMQDVSALAERILIKSDIHTIIAFLHRRMRLVVLLNNKFQANTTSIATEQYPPSCSQHGDALMTLRNI